MFVIPVGIQPTTLAFLAPHSYQLEPDFQEYNLDLYLILSFGLSALSGGFDDNSPLSSVERFDPRLSRWDYISELTTPRGGVGVATVMGCVFAVGGHNGNIYLNTVEAFDPRMNR